MDKPTNYEPSASATGPQDQAIHLDGPIVLSRAEIFAKQLELNAKRLGFNAKQLDLTDKQIELDEQERKLDDEQRELNAQSSVSVVFELMASASARTPAIPVIDAPTESISPCPPIAALPSLLVAALPTACPTAAQEGKRPAPTNESPESPIAPKRHRGKGQISNAGSATGSSLTTCRSLSEKIAVERLLAALDIPALVVPATGAPIFGNAPAAGALATDYSAVDLSAYFAPTADYSAVDFSALVTPATGAPTFDNVPAIGFSAADISAYFAPAAGATMFGYAPTVGISDLDISALIAPAAGATTFGVAPTAGILDRNISDLFAPATSATTFGNVPAIGFSATDISAYFAPAAGATTFGNTPAVDFSAVDFSDLVAPATGATMFDNTPAAGILDRDISALVTPAVNVPALDTSAFLASAVNVPVDAAQFAAILNADQPIDWHLATQEWVYRASRNNASESSQVVKRHSLDMCVSDSVTAANSSCMIYAALGMVLDDSGEQVTSERLLVALGEAPFVGLGYVQDVYSRIYGCELMPSTALPRERIAMLASAVALEHWASQLDEEDTAAVAGLNILRRRDLEIGVLRQSFLEELGLAEDPSAVVLGPRLCYVIIRMCSISVDLLTGAIISSMFLEVTGLDLHSLNVVTRNGVQPMEPSDVCEMVKTWIKKLGRLLTKHNSMEQSLVEVRECNSFYEGQCSSGDPEGRVAKRILMSNRFQSLLFLGLQEAKVEAVIKRLVYVSSKRISSRTKECLEQLSMSLQVQPSS
ncbi:hypothetical protein GGI13_003136 [Coemansia sp. RSA 455]|nr:hypothetical protein GGI13_003136 [Coemansia sp. RSA 455]